MPLEVATHINQLVSTNPTATDPKSQGDDHLRLIKSALTTDLPNIGGPMTASHTELNSLAGVVGAIFPSGTRIPFAQAAAPTGWTRDTTDNADNRMLRVISSGSGGGVGGTHSPVLVTVVPAHTHGFTTGNVSADHNHGVNDPGHGHSGVSFLSGLLNDGQNHSGGSSFMGSGFPSTATTGVTTNGISANHTHSGTTDNGSSATSIQVRYIDLLICTKD